VREPFETLGLRRIIHNLTHNATIVSTQPSLDLISRTLMDLLRDGIRLPTMISLCNSFNFTQRPSSEKRTADDVHITAESLVMRRSTVEMDSIYIVESHLLQASKCHVCHLLCYPGEDIKQLMVRRTSAKF
jgi:hypothetical protein